MNEIELEQAVIERWTGMKANTFRIRVKVGSLTTFTTYRYYFSVNSGPSNRYVHAHQLLIPLDTGTDFQWRLLDFIRTT